MFVHPRMARLLATFTFILLSMRSYAPSQTAHSDSQRNPDSVAVRSAMTNFLEAFDNLEWNRFQHCFDRNATVFFPPSAGVPRRANGISEIETIFKRVFENIRAGRQNPPFQNIHPLDVRLQMLHDAAIVTFHLKDGPMCGRRTIIFRKHGDSWLIVHIHASAIEAKD